jgi:putative ABC transport system permease protein
VDRFALDFRYALRALLRTPLLFGAAVLTLAVGSGLATGVLAVAYGVLLRPLPYPHPERLVAMTVHSAADENRTVGIALSEFEDWREQFRAFEHVSAHSVAEFTVRGRSDARSVPAAMVTDGFFETLGMRAAEGDTSAIAPGAAVAAISRRLANQLGRDDPWRQQGLTIGGAAFRVGAVIPPTFTVPSDEVDVWIRADEVSAVTLFGYRDQRRFQLIGRLSSGVTLEQAREDARRVAREIDQRQEPRQKRDVTVRLLHERSREEAKRTVLPFVAGAALVLFIACANVSGLLVGRAVARDREFAVRRALGGTVGQILRSCLAESLSVALAGWALGLFIAALVVTAFEKLAAGSVHNLAAVRLDLPVVLGSFFLAIVVAVASGGAPALRAARSEPGNALKHATERVGRGSSAMRSALVVGQIAMTVVLLVAAGLLMRTVQRVAAAERGFNTANSVAMRLPLAQAVRFEVHERAPFLHDLLAQVRALPGVVAAGVGSDLPPNTTQLELTIRIVTDDREEMFALSPAAVTPGYLEALGVTLQKGRLFEERDRVAAPPPIVISEAAARMMFQNRDAVGREWPANLPGPPGKRVKPIVIGVVRDIRHKGLDQAPPAMLYALWEFLAPSNAHLVVRTAGAPASVAPALRRIVHDLDPSLPIFPVETLDEVVSQSIADRTLRLQLAGTFAALALALASVALWGAMAQNVLDRRRELAVRLALGSTGGGAVRLMVRGGAILILLGIVLGEGASAVAARMLQHLLHGVAPFDPLTFTGGAAIAAAISMLACYLPARRAARISPAELLRDA